MTKLAPYVVPIPKFITDSGDRELIDWYVYDNKWKQDININLGFGDAILDIIAALNSAIHQINALIVETGSNRARINEQSRALQKVNQLVSGLTVENGKLRASIGKQEKAFQDFSQLLSQIMADNGKLRARLSEKDREIKNIQQQMASN